MQKTIGLVFADEMEFLPFLRLVERYAGEQFVARGRRAASFTLSDGDRTLLLRGVECGIGKVCAAETTAFLIAQGADVILNAGLAGAISGVRRGDFVAGSSFRECDFDLTPIGRPLGKQAIDADPQLLSLAAALPEIHVGAVGTGDLFLADPDKKEQYKRLFSLTAFDMESAAIAQVCKGSGVPFCSLKQISDDADDCSASDYTEMNDRAEDALCGCVLALCKKILREDALW
jgi:5'-methylthioadenosine/S-adenosylhomocysteine nucleosidase